MKLLGLFAAFFQTGSPLYHSDRIDFAKGLGAAALSGAVAYGLGHYGLLHLTSWGVAIAVYVLKDFQARLTPPTKPSVPID